MRICDVFSYLLMNWLFWLKSNQIGTLSNFFLMPSAEILKSIDEQNNIWCFINFSRYFLMELDILQNVFLCWFALVHYPEQWDHRQLTRLTAFSIFIDLVLISNTDKVAVSCIQESLEIVSRYGSYLAIFIQ